MAGERVRLYVRGSIMGYKRSKANQHSHTSLIKIDGVETKEECEFYLGKRIAFIYKAKTLKKGTFYRCIWGKVCSCARAHPSRASRERRLEEGGWQERQPLYFQSPRLLSLSRRDTSLPSKFTKDSRATLSD